MAKLTLLDEALIEERKITFESQKITANMPGSDIVKILLPNYKMFPQSVGYHNSRARINLLHGGVRGGKTVPQAAEAIKLSFVNKPYNHFSFSATQDNANATMCVELENHLRKNFIRFRRIKSDGLYLIYWGEHEEDIAHIYTWGIGNMIKGVTGASGDFNEPYSMPNSDVLIGEERISYEAPGLWYKKTYGGTYEPNVMDWGHEDYHIPECDTPELFKALYPTEGNPYLTPEYIQGLKNRYTPEEQMVYMNGIPVNLAQGKVYTLFSRAKHVKDHYLIMNEPETSEVKRIIVSFDFNVNPIVAVEINIKGKLRSQVHEYKLNRSHTVEMCRFIIQTMKDKYPGIEAENKFKYSVVITGDATGKREQSSSGGYSDIDLISKEFGASGFQYTVAFEDSNPLVRDRINYTEKLLEMGYYEVSSNCPLTIKDTEQLCWKEGAKGFVVDKSKSYLSHFSDARDYGLWITRRMGIDEGFGSSADSGCSFMDKRRN